MQIIAITIHYLPEDGILNAVKLFTAKLPEGPGEIIQATTDLIQSAQTKLARSNPILFKERFPSFLHTLLLYLTIGDTDHNELICSTVLYGIHAAIQELSIPPDTDPLTVIPEEDANAINAIVGELTNFLSVQYINIWSFIYKFLGILPTLLKSATFIFLQAPIISSMEKMTNPDTKNLDLITNFVAGCANEIGLLNFFTNVELQPDDTENYETLVLPILDAYSSKKNFDDLSFTINSLMPVEETLLENSEEDDGSKRLWHRLWNVLPNCVTTNNAYVEENEETFDQFIDYLCTSMENHRELCRPICRILQNIGSFCRDSNTILLTLSNMAVDQSTSSCVIPAISVVCKSKSAEFINNFFVKLISDKVLPLASDPDSINIACALIDIAIALIPYLTNDNLNEFYEVLIAFVQHRSHLQKKALRTLRILLEKHRTDEMKNATEQLVEILDNTKDSISSSTVRYRLLLMSTLLQLPNDNHLKILELKLVKQVQNAFIQLQTNWSS